MGGRGRERKREGDHMRSGELTKANLPSGGHRVVIDHWKDLDSTFVRCHDLARAAMTGSGG